MGAKARRKGGLDHYHSKKIHRSTDLPAAHHWYREMQTRFGDQETALPVEGGEPISCRFMDVTFLDFCAAFKFVGVQEPQPRAKPAIVGYQNFNPDEEPEAFYYSKLLLHLVWKKPGDWLVEQDEGSHAAAFHRIARDVNGHPEFLRSKCFPQLDGTVNAARQLQAVQATMYMKAHASAHCRGGWLNSKIAEENFKDSLQVLEALRERHGEDIDFLAPDTAATGPASNAFAPVEEGEESFQKLTIENPSLETMRQKEAMNYIISTILRPPDAKDGQTTQRLHMLLHGPGGCGKSVVVRAAAHVLRQSKKGCVIAAPTGVAAFNINGITLHQCCLLPVVNQSYGKACDMPQPDGQKLATLRSGRRSPYCLSTRSASSLRGCCSAWINICDWQKTCRPCPSEDRTSSLLATCTSYLHQMGCRSSRASFGCSSSSASSKVLRNMVIKKGSSKRPAPKAVNLYAT